MGLLSRRVKVTKRGNSHHGHYGEVLEARRAEPGEATSVWYTVALDGGGEACFAKDELQAVGSSDSYDHGRHFCSAPAARTARARLEATLSERICREGRCWHARDSTDLSPAWRSAP